MPKQTVAVIFGSRSAEHDVSIITAIASIIKPLELSHKYNVVPIYIDKKGRWYSDNKLKDINLYSSGNIDDFLGGLKPLAVQFTGGLTILKPGLKNKAINIDVVFPATHGTHGEDGELMGLLEMANVPYVGCGVAASVLAMDKILAKTVATAFNIPTPKYLSCTKDYFEKSTAEFTNKVNDQLKYPVFVKPAHLGSSIGITRVSAPKDLSNALEVALHYDSDALVEEAVNNLVEVTLPIIGNEVPQPALLEQPLTKAEDFFDFETKYMQGGKKGKNQSSQKGSQGYSQIPADLPKALYDKAVKTGLDVYTALGCSGIARVDMLIDSKTNTVYFNEVNPLPGDLYSHNWNKAGISSVDLVEKLVDLAKERFEKKKAIETTFSTNYLKQF